MEFCIHLSDSLVATCDEYKPSDQLERDQPVARRRFVQVQYQSWIKDLELIDVQKYLTEGSYADEYREPADLRRCENALGDRVAKRQQQHQHCIQRLATCLRELAEQIGVRYRCSSQTEIHIAIDLAERAQQLTQQRRDEHLVRYVQ